MPDDNSTDTDDEYDQDAFDIYAQELASTSKDRVMRPAVEKMVRQFFRAADEKKWDNVMVFFGTHPVVIGGLEEPGSIFRGRNDVLDYFKTWNTTLERTVSKMIIVDRGRVTCHLITFYQNAEDEKIGLFKEMHTVAIIDLDNKNRILRLEYRDFEEEIKTHEGDSRDLEAMATKAEEKIMRINYLS